MKNITAMTEFFHTSNTTEFLPPRRLFNNDYAEMAKVERNLNAILDRYRDLLLGLYICTDGENFAHVDTHGEFINLWELCVIEGDGAFETVTNWVKYNELYEIDDVTFKTPKFMPAFGAFRKLHFLERRREELLDKRDKLMEEYGNDYRWDAELFTSYTQDNPKKKKSA